MNNTRASEKSKRTWRVKLAALSLGLVLFWGLPELVVRLINPPLPSFRTVTFGDPEVSPRLFVRDLRLGWALRPNTEVRFLDRRVRTNEEGFRGPDRSKNRDVILCLGDSTTFGWGVGQSETFAAQLDQRLERNPATAGRWQVFNAGVPAYSSAQLLVNARRLIPRAKPKFVVICTGNNEGWPVERSDRSTYLDRPEAFLVGAELLGQSRWLGWLMQTIVGDRAKPYRAPPARLAVPRVSQSELSENLSAIQDLATKHGARLILVAPTVNPYHPLIERELLRLADTEDHRGDPGAPPSAEAKAALAQWRAQYAMVNELLDAKEFHEAEVKARELLSGSESDMRYQWLLGVVLCASGRLEEGEAMLAEAFEQHPFPDRCKPSYLRVIKEFAQSGRLPWIDPNAMFKQASNGSLPLGYYLDWCHPSVIGHALIADALASIVDAEIARPAPDVPLDRTTATRLVPAGNNEASASRSSTANARRKKG